MAIARSSRIGALWQRLVAALPRHLALPDDSRLEPHGGWPGRSQAGAGRQAWICSSAAAPLAGWITLSEIHRLNHSDSLIPIFASLYQWTWFYWGQNRYGMLTALLAMPVHHPLANVLVQNWMALFSGLMVFPMVHAYLLGWRNAPLAGLVGATLFLLTGSKGYHQDYLIIQPYALSTCLGLAGLLVMEGAADRSLRASRQILSGALLFLSYWVSLGAAFAILPLFAIRWVVNRARSHFDAGGLGKRLLLIVVPVLVNWQIAVRYPYRGDFGWTPPQTWPGNWATLMVNTYRATSPAFLAALGLLLVVGCIAWARYRDRARLRQGIAALITAVLAALVYSAVVAATVHVRASNFPFRYALVSVILLVGAAASWATSAMVPALQARWQAYLQTALLLVALVGVTARYGAPSYARVRAIAEQRFGKVASALVNNQCTHVLGDYWEVWGAVLHANLQRYESGSTQALWALTGRSQVTRDQWLPLLNQGLIGVPRSPRSDQSWQAISNYLRLPKLELVRETPDIRIFAVQGTGHGTSAEVDSLLTKNVAVTSAVTALTAGGPPASDAMLLKAEGLADKTIHGCIRREKDGTIVGKGCPPGLLVFGPQAAVPKGGNLRFAFDVRSDENLSLLSAIVSSEGRVRHGVMAHVVEPGAVGSVAFGVSLAVEVAAAEGRIWIRSDGPVNFEIANLRFTSGTRR